MARFMLIFRGGAAVRTDLGPAERKSLLDKWSSWSRVLVSTAHHVPGGHPLEVAGKMLRGSERTVSERPYSEAAELVTGTLLVEAASIDDATELAKGCPILDVGGSVEVRPILERPV